MVVRFAPGNRLIAAAVLAVIGLLSGCSSGDVPRKASKGVPGYVEAHICVEFSILSFYFAEGKVPQSAEELVRVLGPLEYNYYDDNDKLVDRKLTPQQFSIRIVDKSSKRVTYDQTILGLRETRYYDLPKATPDEIESVHRILRNLRPGGRKG